MPNQTIAVNVNSSVGILATTYGATNTTIGVYHIEEKTLILKVPFRITDIQLPKELADYTVIHGYTDLFFIQCWRPRGYVSVKELIQEYDRNLNQEAINAER